MNQRRAFIYRALGAATAGLSAGGGVLAGSTRSTSSGSYVAPVPADTGARGRVVVIGGGMAGATAAKYLRLWGGQALEVVLIESDAAYLSNIMSNFVLTGTRTLESLSYSHANLVSRYGVQLVTGRVTSIVPGAAGGTVMLGTTRITYDRLVVAPGLEFDPVPGVPADRQGAFPHAWKAGAQTNELRRQLLAMPATGGTYLMSIPAAPYRCPPGPYERACLVADWLKRNRPRSKVVVLDENADITAEAASFHRAYAQLYPGIVDYRPGTALKSISGGASGGGTVYTAEVSAVVGGVAQLAAAGETFANVSVINPITPQRAGSVLAAVAGAGVLDALGGRFAGVNALSYESAVPGIHVIGDASHSSHPKAGHISNQEAKICADAITRLLRGQQPDPAPVTNSACYSPVDSRQASWLTAVYQYRGGAMALSAGAEAEAWSGENFEQMGKWFNQLMADSFA